MDIDREYYRHVHGFDPIDDKIVLDSVGDSYRYEKGFFLENDRALFEAQVEIWARVDVDFGKVRNRIVFKRDGKEATVDCVHTAVCSLTVGEAFSTIQDGEKIVELAKSTENKPVDLVPEEHFASLKSYVGGLADFGIENLLAASYHSETINPMILPFGFNSAMQKQLTQALRRIAPTATRQMIRNHILNLARTVSEDWFNNRLDLINNIYDIKDAIFTDPDAFFELFELTKSTRLLIDCAGYKDTNPWIWNHLPLEEYPRLRVNLAENSYTTPEILEKLAKDPDPVILLRVAKNPSTPQKSLHVLAQRGDLATKRLIAKNPKAPPSSFFYLVKVADAEVKLSLAQNPSTPQVILERFAMDIHNTNMELKRLLASNRATPPTALEMLASEKDLQVKQLLAVNERTPLWVLDRLSEEDATVRVKVERNKQVPEALRKKIQNARKNVVTLSSYHGENGIIRADADALAILEEDLGIRFHPIEKSKSEAYFILKDARIMGLGLKNLGLTLVPKTLENLINLEHLDLSGNALEVLPDALGSMTNLKDLNLANNNLSQFPDCIHDLFLLESLNLEKNALKGLPPNIGALKFLRTLNLADNSLETLPEEIGYLPSLEYLNLKGNQLRELPENIGVLLHNLREFNLSKNQLSHLPQNLAGLENLEILDLSDNQLHQLPDSTRQLHDLRYLRVTKNQLSTFRGILGGLTKLIKLEARHNKLIYVPESIVKLKDLSHLDLGNNQLTGLPWSIGSLQNLRTLYLDHNLLTVLPEPVTNLANLEILNLENNLIETLPNLDFFTGLRSVNIFSNPLPKETITQIRKEIPYPPLKIFLLGDGGVGKTTLLMKYIKDKFVPDTPMTIGVDFFTRVVEFEPGCFVRVHFWDVAGAERFRFMLPSYMSGTAGAIFVVDLTRFITLENIDTWVGLIRNTVGNVPLVLVAMKSDMDDQRSVDQDYLQQFINELNFAGYYEVSAKTGQNVEEIFADITRRAMQWREDNQR